MADALQAAVFFAGYWYWARHSPRSFGYVALGLWTLLLGATLATVATGVWRARTDAAPEHVVVLHHGGAEATAFLGRYAGLMAVGWWCAWISIPARRFGWGVGLSAAPFTSALWANRSGIVPPFEDEVADAPLGEFFWLHELAWPGLLLVAVSVMLILLARRVRSGSNEIDDSLGLRVDDPVRREA